MFSYPILMVLSCLVTLVARVEKNKELKRTVTATSQEQFTTAHFVPYEIKAMASRNHHEGNLQTTVTERGNVED